MLIRSIISQVAIAVVIEGGSGNSTSFPASSKTTTTRVFVRGQYLALSVTNQDGDYEIDGDGIGIGIDLGTTNSAVALWNASKRRAEMITIPGNGRTMPSVVTTKLVNVAASSSEHGKEGLDFVVGREACNEEIQMGGAYRNVKRILGTGGRLCLPSHFGLSSSSTSKRQLRQLEKQRQQGLMQIPFVKINPGGKTYKSNTLTNQLYDAEHHPTLLQSIGPNNDAISATTSTSAPDIMIRPEAISGAIIKHLVETAQMQTGKQITRAVIGVPSYFNDAQREATLRAAQDYAAIDKVKLLREPEAAALAYGTLDSNAVSGSDDEEELVLVFDLGGGTYDVSMLLVSGGLTEILCTSGNSTLGGSDWDARVSQHLMQHLSNVVVEEKESSLSVPTQWSDLSKNAIVRASERIRIYLSNQRVAYLALPLDEEAWASMEDASSVIVEKEEFPEHSLVTNSTHSLSQLSRTTLEQLCRPELEALLRPIREVAIMSGALLPGDTRPSIAQAALDAAEALRQDDVFLEAFYQEIDEEDRTTAAGYYDNEF